MNSEDSGFSAAAERAKAIAARATDPDPNERYKALEAARRLPAAIRADVARRYLLDSSVWVRTLAQALLEPPRAVPRSRPALLHELDAVLRGTHLGTRQRANLAKLLEDAQAVGSTGDLALAADRASRLVTRALSEVGRAERSPLTDLQIFLRHVAAYARPAPVSRTHADLAKVVATVTRDRRDTSLVGEFGADVNAEAAEVVFRELLDNSKEAGAKSVRVESAMTDSIVTLRVTNTGNPLRVKEVESLFTPWFTTKEGHAGLGLYLASSALAEVGGEMQLAQEEPVTFVVTMPTSHR